MCSEHNQRSTSQNMNHHHHTNLSNNNNNNTPVKVIFILIDGIGDVSLSALNYSTPLQYLSHDQFSYYNQLSRYGLNGVHDSVLPGLACGSDTAHLNIFHYRPMQYYHGRGAYESLGTGLSMCTGDIAFKCNFASMDQNRIVLKRRVDRNFASWGTELCNLINNIKLLNYSYISIQCRHATEHRCGIVIHSNSVLPEQQLTDSITGTDPLKDNLLLRQCQPINPHDIIQLHTCRVINEFTDTMYHILSNHSINIDRVNNHQLPANIVLLRGCGQLISVPSFQSHNQYNSCMMAPTCIIRGLGQSIHMNILQCQQATGDYHTNLYAKIDTLYNHMFIHDTTCNFGFLHIKAVDDAGHDQSIQLKLQWLNNINRMLPYLYNKISYNSNVLYVLTGDHTTPVLYGDHSNDTVPIVLCPNIHRIAQYHDNSNTDIPPNIQTDNNIFNELLHGDTVSEYNEISCSNGILGRMTAYQIMPLIHKLTKLMSNCDNDNM